MKIYNTNHISTINFTNHSTPYIMTDTQKFQHTRGLEKQVRDLQAVVQRPVSYTHLTLPTKRIV